MLFDISRADLLSLTFLPTQLLFYVKQFYNITATATATKPTTKTT